MVGIIVAMEVEIDLIKNSLEEKETKEINSISLKIILKKKLHFQLI